MDQKRAYDAGATCALRDFIKQADEDQKGSWQVAPTAAATGGAIAGYGAYKAAPTLRLPGRLRVPAAAASALAGAAYGHGKGKHITSGGELGTADRAVGAAVGTPAIPFVAPEGHRTAVTAGGVAGSLAGSAAGIGLAALRRGRGGLTLGNIAAPAAIGGLGGRVGGTEATYQYRTRNE